MFVPHICGDKLSVGGGGLLLSLVMHIMLIGVGGVFP